MKPTHLVLAALIAAILPAPTRAEELANPAEGAVCQIFNMPVSQAGGNHRRYLENFAEVANRIYRGMEAPISTRVDTSDGFTTCSDDSYRLDTGMWRGFLKCKNGGLYTIVMSTDGGSKFPLYCIWVNGRQCAKAQSNTFAFDVELKAGFNSICLVAHGWKRYSTFMSIKPNDSIREPKNIGPCNLWHEDEPEDEEW